MKNSFVFVLILLFGVIVVGSAQTGTVRGNIYEKESGSPVIYCNVQLAGTKFGTTTDLDGFLPTTGPNRFNRSLDPRR